MTKETIFRYAVEKATRNGWAKGSLILDILNDGERSFNVDAMARNICFQHSFAKAFFGEFCIGSNGKKHKPYDFMCTPEWYCQLQNMVVEKDPIYFLKKFL